MARPRESEACEHPRESEACEHPGCPLPPTFGHSETRARRRCRYHRRSGDVRLRRRLRCALPGCAVQASYGPLGGDTSHCSDHAVAGMIIYPRKRCEQCRRFAQWALSRTAKKRRCGEHRGGRDIDLCEAPPAWAPPAWAPPRERVPMPAPVPPAVRAQVLSLFCPAPAPPLWEDPVEILLSFTE